jgi:hypothetical protein
MHSMTEKPNHRRRLKVIDSDAQRQLHQLVNGYHTGSPRMLAPENQAAYAFSKPMLIANPTQPPKSKSISRAAPNYKPVPAPIDRLRHSSEMALQDLRQVSANMLDQRKNFLVHGASQ